MFNELICDSAARGTVAVEVAADVAVAADVEVNVGYEVGVCSSVSLGAEWSSISLSAGGLVFY